MSRQQAKTAANFTTQLQQNSRDWKADRISFEEFGQRQGAAWDAIERAGSKVKVQVLTNLRQALPGGSQAVYR